MSKNTSFTPSTVIGKVSWEEYCIACNSNTNTNIKLSQKWSKSLKAEFSIKWDAQINKRKLTLKEETNNLRRRVKRQTTICEVLSWETKTSNSLRLAQPKLLLFNSQTFPKLTIIHEVLPRVMKKALCISWRGRSLSFHQHFINISWTFLPVQDLEGAQALQLTMLEGLALLQNCKI